MKFIVNIFIFLCMVTGFSQNSDEGRVVIDSKLDLRYVPSIQQQISDGTFIPTISKVGDIVVLPTQGFTKLEHEGEEYYVGPENQILAKVTKTLNVEEALASTEPLEDDHLISEEEMDKLEKSEAEKKEEINETYYD